MSAAAIESPMPAPAAPLPVPPETPAPTTPKPEQKPKKTHSAKEIRYLNLILQGKVEKIPSTSISDQMMVASMKKVAYIVEELSNNPRKIDSIVVAVQSDDLGKQMSPRDPKTKVNENLAKEITDNPTFPDDVKNLADVPIPFLWAIMRKASKVPISDATISTWMIKSPKLFRQAFSYLTGIQHFVILAT